MTLAGPARRTPASALDNLPYGIFSTAAARPRTGVAVGDHVLDLAGRQPATTVHATGSLDAFMAPGPDGLARRCASGSAARG